MREICFASNNTGKIKEMKSLLEGKYKVLSLEDIGCHEDIPETKDTFEGNSLDKASFIWEKYQIDCISDDSGLEVIALNNEPGVFSARYAGTPKNDVNNIKLLLKNLDGVNNRKASFRTVITLIISGNIKQFEGSVKGTILQENKGHKGFGYDPIFVPEGFEHTFAEMRSTEKNAISHRGKAVKKLVAYLRENT